MNYSIRVFPRCNLCNNDIGDFNYIQWACSSFFCVWSLVFLLVMHRQLPWPSITNHTNMQPPLLTFFRLYHIQAHIAWTML